MLPEDAKLHLIDLQQALEAAKADPLPPPDPATFFTPLPPPVADVLKQQYPDLFKRYDERRIDLEKRALEAGQAQKAVNQVVIIEALAAVAEMLKL